MKLHLASTPGQNRVTGYGAGYVAVNDVRHESSVVVTASSVSPWEPSEFEDLSAAHLERLLELEPEIVLLGTGAAQRFPSPELARILITAGVGMEVMDSQAACRTYNILMAEGRKVVAAILLG